MKDKEVSFVIGRPWENDKGSVAAHMMHNNVVHHGTLLEAETMRRYVEQKEGKKQYVYRLKKI